jgi:hypothetical protein
MARSESAPIDRVYGLVKALRERAEAAIEKAEDGPPGKWDWREPADPAGSRGQFDDAYNAFADGIDTMKAATLDLENWGYEDPEFSYVAPAGRKYFHASAIRACYVALAKLRQNYLMGTPGGVASLLVDTICPLEKALLRACVFCTAGQKRQKRLAIPMTAEAKTILEALAEEYPMAMTNTDIADQTHIRREIVGKQMRWLEHKRRGFVKRPEGTKRKGRAITPAGLSAIGWPVETEH